MKRIALAIILILIITLSSASWLVYSQVSELQNQNTSFKSQNNELQGNNSALQNQIGELEKQKTEQKAQLENITYQLALTRPLLVKITAFKWLGGFNPIGGLTLSNPVNVTIQNSDVIPLCGLTLWVKLYDQNLATRIDVGNEDDTRISRIDSGQTQVIMGVCYTNLPQGNYNLSGSVCVVTLMVGSVVLDTWKQAI
jgi:hypothetical protein